MMNQNQIIAKGAEATIYSGSFLEIPVVLKRRYPKKYRLSQIDREIRIQRMRAEARIMTQSWKIGVRVPALLGIDINNMTLIIEKIHGAILFDLLNSDSLPKLKQIFNQVGNQIGILHKNNIIHGDLTVFNIIITSQNIPWLIDFGLAQISIELEKKADDLLTFHNTLKAVHSEYQELLDTLEEGYLDKYKKGRKTFDHMQKIQSRARYIAREDRLE